MKNHTAIRILAGFMGLYHIGMGIFGTLSGEMAARVGSLAWGAHVTVDPQFTYLTKFLGAYVIAFGAMMLLIAKNPVRYGALVYVAVLLAAIRILDRLVFSHDLQLAFGIDFSRTITAVIVVAALNLGLLLLKPKAAESGAV